MIILHQIGKPLSDDFKKMYIVRKLDNDIKRQKFIHVPELSPGQILFEKYRELARNNLWNEQTFKSVYLPVFLSEMSRKESLSILHKLAEDSYNENIALCCYCDDEKICHRSIVGGILKGMKVNIDCSDEYLEYYKIFISNSHPSPRNK